MVSGPSSVAWGCNGYDVGLATHEVCTGMGTARGFSRGCGYECCGKYRGDGSDNCGIPAGMDFITAGTPALNHLRNVMI